MAKDQHGGFVPPKGNPSGNGKNQQGIKSAFAGVDPEMEEEIANRYTENDGPAANVNMRHHNRNVNKGEDTTKPNEQLDQ
jgi:hypothetical protein